MKKARARCAGQDADSQNQPGLHKPPASAAQDLPTTHTDRRLAALAYRVTLQPEPRCADAERALRGLLKTALRKFGLRCTGVEELPSEAAP
jgi:hypothetical protein